MKNQSSSDDCTDLGLSDLWPEGATLTVPHFQVRFGTVPVFWVELAGIRDLVGRFMVGL